MAKPGDIIGNKYEVLKEIGRGGMSIVYLAMDKNLNKSWAIKEVRRDMGDESNQTFVQSFLTEADMMKKLDHPTLPRIVDIIDTGGLIYVVMDYIEGEALNNVLKKHNAQKQELVIEWGIELCNVLSYLHTRIPPVIYRDMKPANIMLRPDGHVKLIDFGIAREYKAGSSGDTEVMGTRGYASPEQLGGQQQTDARSDIYSLGVTLYHLVTGKGPDEPPYELYPIRYWNSNLSSGFEQIIQKSVQIDPENRYQTAVEMLYALENVDRLGDGYRKKQQSKLNAFIATIILSVAFGGVGVLGTVMKGNAETKNYEANIDLGTVEGYKTAIDINPDSKTAYMEWINMYMQNQTSAEGVKRKEYSAEEARALESKFDRGNLNKLREKDPQGYAEVSYGTGKLNWYFYTTEETETKTEDAGSQIERMVRSIKWFQMVQELNKTSKDQQYLSERDRSCVECYYNIGCFYRDKEIAEEGDTGGEKIYLDYLQNVTKLVKTIGIDKVQDKGNDSDVDVIMRAQMYDLIIYSLDSDMDLFKNQGATKAEVQELFDIASENTKALEPVRKREEEVKKRVVDRLDSVQKKIDMAYGGKG